MPATIRKHTTRRGALRSGISASVAAAIGVPAVASAIGDAHLIRKCRRLVALQTELDAVYKRRTTAELEEATEGQLGELYSRQSVLIAEIEKAGPPTTLPGIRALAQAGLAICDSRDSDGEIITVDASHWMLAVVAEQLTQAG